MFAAISIASTDSSFPIWAEMIVDDGSSEHYYCDASIEFKTFSLLDVEVKNLLVNLGRGKKVSRKYIEEGPLIRGEHQTSGVNLYVGPYAYAGTWVDNKEPKNTVIIVYGPNTHNYLEVGSILDNVVAKMALPELDGNSVYLDFYSVLDSKRTVRFYRLSLIPEALKSFHH